MVVGSLLVPPSTTYRGLKCSGEICFSLRAFFRTSSASLSPTSLASADGPLSSNALEIVKAALRLAWRSKPGAVDAHL